MKIKSNEIFRQLLTEYNLPEDFSFSVDLPTEIQNLLADKILITELGVTLKSFDRLHKAKEDWENQSIIEDNENHFHVDSHIDSSDSKNAFMLGIKCLTLLAQKFQKENVNEIRFWFSFQTPELAKSWIEQNNLSEEDDEHFISDRLSFYKKRKGEEIISTDLFESKFWAILTIDI